MYKDKEKQRETTRERVRRYRGKGVTSSTVDRALQGKELTLEVAQKIEKESHAGITYDFSVPKSAREILPEETINRILACLRERANVAKIFGILHALPDDSSARWDRAITYHNWKLAYKPVKLTPWLTGRA